MMSFVRKECMYKAVSIIAGCRNCSGFSESQLWKVCLIDIC